MAFPALPPIPARAEAGAKLLDAYQPGWQQWIDLDALDLADPEGCVLGQLYGTYDTGMDDLHQLVGQTGNLDEAGCGFVRCQDEPESIYPELTTAWHAQITARQTGGGAR